MIEDGGGQTPWRFFQEPKGDPCTGELIFVLLSAPQEQLKVCRDGFGFHLCPQRTRRVKRPRSAPSSAPNLSFHLGQGTPSASLT